MLKYAIVDTLKGIPQAVAEEEMVRGAILDDGLFFADKERHNDGLAAAYNQKEKEFEKMEVGAIYNRVPTRVGEEYYTTEVNGAEALSEGAALTVADGKFAAGEGTVTGWVFAGVYANPYDLNMYRVRRVK